METLKGSADEILKEIKSKNGQVVVVFSAEWCGACKLYLLEIEKAEKAKEKLNFVKIDHSESPEIFEKYRIEAIPTTIIFENGKPVENKILHGYLQYNDLLEWLLQ